MAGAGRRKMFEPLDMEEYLRVVASMFKLGDAMTPGSRLLEHMSEAYACMEAGSVGQAVTLRDVLNALTQVLTTDREAQVSMYFRLFDLDGNGELDGNEILLMVLTAKATICEAASSVIAMLKTCVAAAAVANAAARRLLAARRCVLASRRSRAPGLPLSCAAAAAWTRMATGR